MTGNSSVNLIFHWFVDSLNVLLTSSCGKYDFTVTIFTIISGSLVRFFHTKNVNLSIVKITFFTSFYTSVSQPVCREHLLGVLTNFLIQVCRKLKKGCETLFYTHGWFDDYEIIVVTKKTLQLFYLFK